MMKITEDTASSIETIRRHAAATGHEYRIKPLAGYLLCEPIEFNFKEVVHDSSIVMIGQELEEDGVTIAPRMYIVEERRLYIYTVIEAEETIPHKADKVVNLSIDASCGTMNPTGKALAIGGSDGRLQLVLADGTLAMTYPVATRGAPKSAIRSIQFVQRQNDDGLEDLLIVFDSKQIVRISKINMAAVIKCAKEKDKAKKLRQMMQKLNFERFDLTTPITGDAPTLVQLYQMCAHSAAILYATQHTAYLDWYTLNRIGDDQLLTHRGSLNPEILPNGIRTMQLAFDSTILFVVDTHGLLSLWDPRTLCLLFEWGAAYEVHDMVFLDRSSEDQSIEFALITESDIEGWMLRICRIGRSNLHKPRVTPVVMYYLVFGRIVS